MEPLKNRSLDVPYYLSHHREKMVSVLRLCRDSTRRMTAFVDNVVKFCTHLQINAVRKELNRVYRLFVQRNPEFENRGGRVSLVCHSLGSALATDMWVLSGYLTWPRRAVPDHVSWLLRFPVSRLNQHTFHRSPS